MIPTPRWPPWHQHGRQGPTHLASRTHQADLEGLGQILLTNAAVWDRVEVDTPPSHISFDAFHGLSEYVSIFCLRPRILEKMGF